MIEYMQAGYAAATSPANFRIIFAVLVAAVGAYLAFGEHVAAWWKKTQADIAAKKTASSTPQAADANADLVAGFEHLLAIKEIQERQQLRSPEEIKAAFIAGIGSIYKPTALPGF